MGTPGHADQKEREDWENLSEEDRMQMAQHDLTRRKRVGEILGEGCFKTADDYMAASLIYQHGDNSDHYYQASIWANRAVPELNEGSNCPNTECSTPLEETPKGSVPGFW